MDNNQEETCFTLDVNEFQKDFNNFPINEPIVNKLADSQNAVPHIANLSDDANAGLKLPKIYVFKYSNFDPDFEDVGCTDKHIRCFSLRCCGYTAMYAFVDFIRLIYEVFMFIYVPYMIWYCNCMRYLIVRYFCRDGSIEAAAAFAVCSLTFANCCLRYIKCPIWIVKFIGDCITDIRYRSFDHARRGCFQYHHEDSCSNKQQPAEDLQVENLYRGDNQNPQQPQQQPVPTPKKKDNSCIGIYKKYISKYDARYRRQEEEKEKEAAHRKERAINLADRATEAGEQDRLLVVEVEENVNKFIEVKNV